MVSHLGAEIWWFAFMTMYRTFKLTLRLITGGGGTDDSSAHIASWCAGATFQPDRQGSEDVDSAAGLQPGVVETVRSHKGLHTNTPTHQHTVMCGGIWCTRADNPSHWLEKRDFIHSCLAATPTVTSQPADHLALHWGKPPTCPPGKTGVRVSV